MISILRHDLPHKMELLRQPTSMLGIGSDMDAIYLPLERINAVVQVLDWCGFTV